MLQAPRFWQEKPGIIARFLQPLAWIYGVLGRLRRKYALHQAPPVPVISVGNLTMGGAGKTPVALALHQLLTPSFRAIHFVTRGYGRKSNGALLVDPACHDSTEVGDEALLLAACGPTWVNRNRYEACVMAHESGAQGVILDDGHQQTWVSPNCNLVVVDAKRGFGNGLVFPAGPLRELLIEGLARADALIVVGEGTLDVNIPSYLPRFRGRVKLVNAEHFRGKRVIGFAGLAYPDKFHDSLQQCAADVYGFLSFPDHHYFTQNELEKLQHLANVQQAQLVTTAKDWVRLPKEMQRQVAKLVIEIEFDQPETLKALIIEKINHGQKT